MKVTAVQFHHVQELGAFHCTPSLLSGHQGCSLCLKELVRVGKMLGGWDSLGGELQRPRGLVESSLHAAWALLPLGGPHVSAVKATAGLAFQPR